MAQTDPTAAHPADGAGSGTAVAEAGPKAAPAAAAADVARSIPHLRLNGPVLERTWTDGTPRDAYDLREFELAFEISRRRAVAFASAAVIGMSLALAFQIGLFWAWVIAAGLSSLALLGIASGLTRRPYLVLKRGAERHSLLIPVKSLEEFREFWLALARIRLEAAVQAAASASSALAGAESSGVEDAFLRHPDDDWYHPQPLPAPDGSGAVTYALTCKGYEQLIHAASLVYRGTVQAIHAGDLPGVTGPIRFAINTDATPHTPAVAAALDACLAGCVAWSAYHGEPIEAVVDWGETPAKPTAAKASSPGASKPAAAEPADSAKPTDAAKPAAEEASS